MAKNHFPENKVHYWRKIKSFQPRPLCVSQLGSCIVYCLQQKAAEAEFQKISVHRSPTDLVCSGCESQTPPPQMAPLTDTSSCSSTPGLHFLRRRRPKRSAARFGLGCVSVSRETCVFA